MMGLRPETLLAQAAGADDPTTGGIIPPLQPSTTFLRDPDNAYRRGFDYARDRNPTYAPAEAVLAALEGGAEALLSPPAWRRRRRCSRRCGPATMWWPPA